MNGSFDVAWVHFCELSFALFFLKMLFFFIQKDSEAKCKAEKVKVNSFRERESGIRWLVVRGCDRGSDGVDEDEEMSSTPTPCFIVVLSTSWHCRERKGLGLKSTQEKKR